MSLKNSDITKPGIGASVLILGQPLKNIVQNNCVLVAIEDFVKYTLHDSHLLIGREFMKDREKYGDEKIDVAGRPSANQAWEQLKIYTIEAIQSVAVFFVFVATSILVALVAKITGPIGVLIIIVAWSISILGAICCIALVYRNTKYFLKFLFTSPPKKTPIQEVADEGRNE
jgi:hypothetical protein